MMATGRSRDTRSVYDLRFTLGLHRRVSSRLAKPRAITINSIHPSSYGFHWQCCGFSHIESEWRKYIYIYIYLLILKYIYIYTYEGVSHGCVFLCVFTRKGLTFNRYIAGVLHLLCLSYDHSISERQLNRMEVMMIALAIINPSLFGAFDECFVIYIYIYIVGGYIHIFNPRSEIIIEHRGLSIYQQSSRRLVVISRILYSANIDVKFDIDRSNCGWRKSYIYTI